jgi:hypothetical protein
MYHELMVEMDGAKLWWMRQNGLTTERIEITPCVRSDR